MKFKSKVYAVGSGVGVYVPKVVADELDLSVGVSCEILIVEDKHNKDKENSILVIFDD